jgi:hypothetical protein
MDGRVSWVSGRQSVRALRTSPGTAALILPPSREGYLRAIGSREHDPGHGAYTRPFVELYNTMGAVP